MKRKIIPTILSLVLLGGVARGVDPLSEGFAHPPAETKPWCYWYWISDNISREGITRDLEAMARVGIGQAFIGNIFLDDIKPGPVKALTEDWWGLVGHAMREGGRVGVNIGMFNCPGWSQSGGPWIKPEQAMRYLVSSETRVKGPIRFERKLLLPKEPFQPVAVLAFPAPDQDAASLDTRSPRITCLPAVADSGLLADGKLDTSIAFPAGAGQGTTPFQAEIEVSTPFTARSLSLHPSSGAFSAQCELQAARGDGSFATVRRFKFDRSNMSVNVGPMPRGPVTVAFSPVTSARFRLILTAVHGAGALAEVDLSGAARVESFVEKQLGKMHPTPLPMWDTYLWPEQTEPDLPGLVVPPGQVLDLTARCGADGTLQWDVPAGDWVILNTGMTLTGTRNSPASPEGQGLEVDKMNRVAARAHFEAFIGQALARFPASERKAFRTVVADSYEMGSQNWTDGFGHEFRRRYGYDSKPWLPALTGRIVGSADQSARFLWDLRRLVADRIATDYVGGLRDLCHAQGLQLWLENYGHWGFPAEFLQYGGQSDRIGGEFWVTGDLGSIECRAASSCANTYGRPVVSAEAFTGGPAYQNAPSALKARGDWAFCEGINHFVLHVSIQQPWEDRFPGVNAWFGTEFDRHNTWFEESRAWVDYIRRCCFLLQQGTRVADAAYFIGEDAPKMTGIRQPVLPAGCDFDYLNAEVLTGKMRVRDGKLTLPHGTAYQFLVLPEQTTMRPQTMRKLRDLVQAGATVVGRPPGRSPSLEGYPKCDDEVRRWAAEVWGQEPATARGEHHFGKGRVVWGRTLEELLNESGLGPDFASTVPLRHTHRVKERTHIYFVANPQAEEVRAVAAFRVAGQAPELWWPSSGAVEYPAVYLQEGGSIRLPLQLGPHGSVFVVFRDRAGRGDNPVTAVTRDGQALFDMDWKPGFKQQSGSASNSVVGGSFTMAVWVKPADETVLPRETGRGVVGMSDKRNDALFPPHGNGFSTDGGHAGCGLAVGVNGVSVTEHGANHFAPVLVHAASLTNWTHLALVYSEGEPGLYLNGNLVRTGLKSGFIAHPGAGPGSGGNPQFRGRLGRFEQRNRALSAAEIAALMNEMRLPDPGGEIGPIQLTRQGNGALEALVWQSGAYELKTADGARHKLETVAVPPPQILAGSWEVQFATRWGGPAQVRFDQLEDWTRRPEEGIKFYSGKATYRKTFRAPVASTETRLWLDLGELRDLATVRLNGKNLGTLWMAPWRVEITAAVRTGENALEVEVVNVWNNRLAGDASLPPEKRLTWLAAQTVRPGAALLPAGLLGPVTIRSAVMVR